MPREEKEEGWNTVEPSLCLKLVCEAVGTFGLSYTVAMTAISTENGGLAPVAVPICAACYLITMVYAIGSVSGCHINPAVSVAVFTWQAISATNDNFAIEWVLYTIAQLIGGCAGSVLGVSLWQASGQFDAYNPYGIFPYVDAGRSSGIALVTEMLALFFFTFCILRTCCDHDKPPLATDGLTIGIALFTAIVGTAAISGGGVNPAVATSLLVANSAMGAGFPVGGLGSFFAVYWVGPYIGAVVAAGLHYMIEVSTSKVFVGYVFLHASDHMAPKKKNEEQI
jgi:glycerol uptake facilitator-like aquaporin